MRLVRQQSVAEWSFLALLVVLCVVLSALQYHWTGEISRAEGERLRNGIRTGAESFAKSFDATLTAYCTALAPARGTVNEYNRAAIHEELFQKWNASHPQPIFRRVGVVTVSPERVNFLEQNLSDGKLSPAAWPDSWRSFQRHFEDDERGPFMAGSGVLFETPVFGGAPVGFGGPHELEWVVFELDTNYLQQVWIPKLARTHFDIPGNLNAQFTNLRRNWIVQNRR